MLLLKLTSLCEENHGEPYIFHPLAVARICADEIRLGPTSIVCALLHDTVEDTNITLNDIEKTLELKSEISLMVLLKFLENLTLPRLNTS